MKKNGAIIFFALICAGSYVWSSCPSNITFQHDCAGQIENVCTPSASCLHVPRFWCLSCGLQNNNGNYYTSWWQHYSGNLWWFNGSWSSPGVNGCCGMWDASSCPSRTMQVAVDTNDNEGQTTHIAYANVELAERPIAGTSFRFCRGYNIEPDPIPRFKADNFHSTGEGGTSSFDITGFYGNDESLDYWVRLRDGTEGFNLPLNPLCVPDGNSVCPPPIAGYNIVAKFVGCAGGVCNCNGPAPPSTGLVTSWNAVVTNGFINQREPQFPYSNIQVSNPATCNASNAYLYIGTVAKYSDNFSSSYVSQNGEYFAWCHLDGLLIAPTEAGKDMQCHKGTGDSIECSYSNGGWCASDNTIYYGPLSAISNYGYSGSICGIGKSGSVTFTLGDGNWFWVIVSTNCSKEGSYGTDSNGNQRPEASGIGNCDYPQELNNVCNY